MEKLELHHELLQEIREKINVDLDKEITLFVVKNENKSITIDHLIDELDLLTFEEDLYKNYFALQDMNDEESIQNEEEDPWQNITDCDTHDEFLRTISRSPFLTSEILDELLKIQFIDNRQTYWEDILIKLQDCLSCSNYDLFLKSLNIHYKLISSHNSCVDGYLNLLKATIKIITRAPIEKFNNQNKLEKNKLLLCIKMIIDMELFVLNAIHISKDKIIEEIVENIISLFSYSTWIAGEDVVILYFVSFVDRRANWFKYLCTSGYTKSMVFNNLAKYRSLLNLVLESFFNLLKIEKVSAIVNSINFYSHICDFLANFLSYYENVTTFIYKTDLNNEYTFPQFMSLTVNAINYHSSPEILEILTSFMIKVFEQNPNLIDQEILEILFRPFENLMENDSMKRINKNAYVFIVIRHIVKVNDKILTNGHLYNKRKYKSIFHTGRTNKNQFSDERNNSNIPQLIIDVMILMLRDYINTSERRENVDDIVLTLLSCCENIYQSHPVFLYNSITSKFILNLKSFYKVLCNFNVSRGESEKVMSLFKYFFKYYSNITKLLNDKLFTLSILNKCFSKKIEISDSLIFHNFSNEIYIEDEVQTQLHLVTQSFLVSAWHKNEIDQNIFIDDLEIGKALCELLSFITGISYDFNLIKMLVNEYPQNDFLRRDTIAVPTIFKLSVQNLRDTLETYTGLLLIRIFISNLDGMIFLQGNLNIKDKLVKIQCQLESESESELDCSKINKCTIIRKNILSHLNSIGHPNRLLNIINGGINCDLTEGTRVSRNLVMKSTPPCDLQKFLQNSRAAIHDTSWISYMKKLFQKNCSEGYKVSVVAEIVSQFPKLLDKRVPHCWPQADMWLPQTHPEEKIAISVIVKFGLENQLLNLGCRHEENLAFLIKQSRVFLNEESEQFDGFDWFVGICFLICSGNVEKSKLFCVNVSHLSGAGLVWHKFGKMYDAIWLDNFLQHLDVILAENTTVYTALKMAGLNPAIIVKKWLSQCFFNVLEFEEICNFIIFSLIHPMECSLYYMLSLFIHNKYNICRLTHTATLENLLNVISLEDFKLTAYFHVINKFATRYRNIIKL